MNGMEAIERLAKDYRDARGLLSERVGALHAEIEDAKRRKVPGIKSALERVAEAHSILTAAIDGHQALFGKPRTQVFHGIKVGLQKAKGGVTFANAARVVSLIRQHLPARFAELVKITEEPKKAALGELSVGELRMIGCQTTPAGDVVLIKATDGEVDKLVKALLKGIEEDAEED